MLYLSNLNMKQDIQNRVDIELLVRSFYDKVIIDDEIGYIFTDVVKVQWEKTFTSDVRFLGKYFVIYRNI